MKIAVLAGGYSPERDVSLASGSLIANALMARGHEVVLADVYVGVAADCLAWRHKGDAAYTAAIAETVPDLAALRARCGGQTALIGPGILDLCRAADVVFLALHGAMGENGQLQATLDSFGVTCYTGSGYLGAALAMDKDVSKRLMRQAGIATAPWVRFDPARDDVEAVLRAVGLPCVVKPCSCGSSVGVSMAASEDDLRAAIAVARAYEGTLVIERRIVGREFSVAVLDGDTLPAIEIIPKQGFYDYKNKYQGGCTTEICPAPLPAEEAAALSASAKAVFAALHLEGYARVDFIRDEAGVFWCLEANTLPGMTPVSLMPQEAAAAGIAYDELCERIACLACAKGGNVH